MSGMAVFFSYCKEIAFLSKKRICREVGKAFFWKGKAGFCFLLRKMFLATKSLRHKGFFFEK
jgi:hypothetical protein